MPVKNQVLMGKQSQENVVDIRETLGNGKRK
jgi:hypothetical protein